MFVANPRESTHGGKAVAVPGDLKGLWELHQNYGSLKWKDLLRPVIDMCNNGHRVGPFLHEMIVEYEDELLAEPSLKEIFFNPLTNKLFVEGDMIKRPKLAETLEVLANEGIAPIYGGGDLGKKLIADIQKYGGIMIEKDLKDYRVEWSDPVSIKIVKNHTVYTTALPTSGAMLIFMLNMLRNDQLKPDLVSYQRMIEAIKIAFAHRTRIGAEENEEVLRIYKDMLDLEYADDLRKLINDTRTSNDVKYYGANYADIDDHGTAHLSILAPNGDAIAVTNTINDIFGAMFRSQSTGIILNDEMDDFSVPGGPNSNGVLPSPNNFPIPGNNPISSMIPTIVLDQYGNVR
jgi:gamma-glutamyltranspeptidase/glutathione hydrolase/leukotriene-C4 hydrolase